ncbi:MAG: TetR family transcriptional regulator [Mycobacteriales bacterium]|nr:MAG: TetR family transcriptional regulator [Pseudonocardiales bacterium]
MARAGRRPGPGSTSDDVLAAARSLFAERGYRGTTLRAIAAAAGVTPAMIHHFFGSKQRVFLAAIRMPIDPTAVLSGLLDGPREDFAEALVRTFVAVWRSDATGPGLRGMLRSAVADEEQAAAVRAFAGAIVLPRTAAALGVPIERVEAALSILIGQAVTRAIIGIEPLASMSDDDVVALFAPAVAVVLGLRARDPA